MKRINGCVKSHAIAVVLIAALVLCLTPLGARAEIKELIIALAWMQTR